MANADEQRILAQYVGWGGLAGAFDKNNSTWSSEYAALKEALTESEYAAARSSTLTAFYTPADVIHPIYRALVRMGVTGGNILEPSCGTGAFIGHRPDSFKESSAHFYGVEIDALTGRIAKQLYQNANIQITGFESTKLPDNFFDCALGNVPFGQYQVSDPQYDRLHFQIHDYFLAKAIDKVRAGGILAFITTSGTLDKKSEDVRRYIAARCDLIGAVRLPNDAFKGIAGTNVTSDILFLQKRDRVMEQDVPWIHMAETADGVPVNRYFAEHPEMICGEMRMISGPYGPRPACLPRTSDKTLEQQLDECMTNLQAQITQAEPMLEEDELEGDAIPADPNVRNFSYTMVDHAIYYRENSLMRRVRKGPTVEGRIQALIEMRDTTRELIVAQLDEMPDEEIARLQAVLNRQYDAYAKEYGRINSRDSQMAFEDDSSYFLLCSLEDIDDDGNYLGKTDMFTKRTIRSARVPDHVDTATEAYALSIGEKAKVDLPYMMALTGKSEAELVADLTGVIYRDPLKTMPDGSPHLSSRR